MPACASNLKLFNLKLSNSEPETLNLKLPQRFLYPPPRSPHFWGMDFAEYEAYFKNMAIKHKFIAHTDDSPAFYTGDPDQWLSASNKKTTREKNCMILLPLSRVVDTSPNPHNPTRFFHLNLMVVSYVGIPANVIAQQERMAKLFDICMDIKARITRDRAAYDKFTNNVIKVFQSDDVTVFPVEGKRAAGFVGWVMQITIGTKSNFYATTQDNWLP